MQVRGPRARRFARPPARHAGRPASAVRRGGGRLGGWQVGEEAFQALQTWLVSQLEAAMDEEDEPGGGSGTLGAQGAGAGGKGFAEQVLALVPRTAMGAVTLAYRLLYLQDALASCLREQAALMTAAPAVGGSGATGGGGGIRSLGLSAVADWE